MKNKITLNKNGEQRKKGSGRKKGSKSFVPVKLKDLKLFCGEEAVVMVSRVWVEQMGYEIEASKPTMKVVKQISQEDSEEDSKISFNIIKH